MSNHNQSERPKRPANNYFKVSPAPFGATPQLIIPFNDSDPEETKQTWLNADAIRAQLDVSQPRNDGAPRYIAIYRQPTAWPMHVPRAQLIGFRFPKSADLRLS